jgi:hypothetical protein
MKEESMEKYDLVIVGAGPGGLASAITAQQLGLSYLVVEKGKRVFQGIIDSYPRGKKVYPTIPKGEDGPFAVEDLAPSLDHNPVEEYVAQIEACVDKRKIAIRLSEEFLSILRDKSEFTLVTSADRYRAVHAVLAIASNRPGELGIYAEAKRGLGVSTAPKNTSAPSLWYSAGATPQRILSPPCQRSSGRREISRPCTGPIEQCSAGWTRTWPEISAKRYSWGETSGSFRARFPRSAKLMKTAWRGLLSRATRST